ncbi:hypothetical protein BK784_28450 [Bacillus thuringiensis serovar medellin]|uniref:Replication-relaxation family protein n=1 Tax=Bacillus thuringiensis subsp. medellin TaxID=79672 RepID=A0A9X6N2P7_BACTV|nr:replication-relaxation family protein [Bacillus thuringiensis]OUB88450.1 hypothetical protein BK784_28450 [Bacillus thuringiensis serovar medellin]
MKKDTWILKYINGKNHSGMYLTISDMYTLLFLYEQRLLTVKQLYTFNSFFYNESMNYNAFRNRLNKMSNLKLLKKENYYLKKRYGYEMNMFTIGDKGLFILEQAGFIKNAKENFYISRRQYEHTLGIKEVVLQTIELEANRKGWILGLNGDITYVFKNFIKEYGIDNLYPFSLWPNKPHFIYESNEWGSHINLGQSDRDKWTRKDDVLYSIQPFPLFKDIKEEDNNLKPDWIFRINKHFLSIEVDTGTERNNIIESKIKKYIKLTKLMPTINHHVIFSIVDNSYPTVSDHGTKKQRTANLKELIKNIPELAASNLKVYVTPMRRIQAVMYQILEKTRYQRIPEQEFHNGIISRLNNVITFPYTATLINTDESLKELGFYHQGFLSKKLPVYHFHKKDEQNAKGLLEFDAIVIKMQEGNVNSYKDLSEVAQLLVQSDSERGKLVMPRDTKIIAIYPKELEGTETSVMHDIFHSSASKQNVILIRENDIRQFNPCFFDIQQREMKLFEEFF